MEEYIRLLLDQIRCKTIHKEIEKEIRMHMEDQIECNKADGMSQEEAEAAAVRDMGSAVEVGISLDRIHRPKPAWSMILLMAVITVAANLLHGSRTFAAASVLGFVVMMLIYYIDYTWIASHCKMLAVVMLLAGLYASFHGTYVNGLLQFVIFPGVHFSAATYLSLLVPLYAAIVYRYYGTDKKGFAMCVLWMAVPIFMGFRMSSLTATLTFALSMAIVLGCAVAFGWFQISKVKTFAFLGAYFIGCPAMVLLIMIPNLKAYQSARLQAFLDQNGEAYYQTGKACEYLYQSSFLGRSAEQSNIAASLPGWQDTCVLPYLAASYGLAVVIAVCILIAALVIFAFRISFRQKNQLGMLMGIGCASVLAVNFLENLMVNLGLLPMTTTYLPFFSKGGSEVFSCYILVGMIMSIYRCKDIYGKHIYFSSGSDERI